MIAIWTAAQAFLAPILKALADWRVLAVIAVAVFGLWGLHETRRADGLAVAKNASDAALVAAEKAAKLLASQTKISDKAEATQIIVQHDIQVQTRTVIQKVPVYVTPEADARCILPVGFVRLYNAAATGADPAAVPDPAGRPDGAPSGIACSEVAADLADNFGIARQNAAELTGLQDWNQAQAAIH